MVEPLLKIRPWRGPAVSGSVQSSPRRIGDAGRITTAERRATMMQLTALAGTHGLGEM